MRHDVLPGIGREHHREAIQALNTVATILGIQVHDLPREFGVREVRLGR